MNKILTQFLDKPISRDVYYIPTEISPKEIDDTLKFLIDTSIEAEKIFFKEAKESNSLKEMEIEKNSLKDLAKILKDGIENIEKILNEWE